MSQFDRTSRHVPPEGARASNGLILSKKMVQKAVVEKARSEGFSTTTIRATTVLFREAINEFAQRQVAKASVDSEVLGPGELVELTIERLQKRIDDLESINQDLVQRNRFLRDRVDIPIEYLQNFHDRISILNRLDRFEEAHEAFHEAQSDVRRALEDIVSGGSTDPSESAKWALTRLEKLFAAALRVGPVRPK